MSTLEASHDLVRFNSENVDSSLRATLPIASSKQTVANSIRILVADGQTLFRESLRAFLHKHAGFKVIGEAGPGDDLVGMTMQLRPDVMLVDIFSPGINGLKSLGEIRDARLEVQIIVLAGEVPEPEMLSAIRCGAKGFVLKTSPSTVLIKAIRKVSQGQYWLDQKNLAVLVHAATDNSRIQGPTHDHYGLTPRESEIVLAVLDGYSNPDIAEKFGLSEQTIKHHLSHIFDKLGVYSRLELALFAVSHSVPNFSGPNLDLSRPRIAKKTVRFATP